MARERMAKLIKYDHFDARIGHKITYLCNLKICIINMFHLTCEKMDHKSACPCTNVDQILIRLSSYFEDILLNNISRSGPKMSLIRRENIF